LHVWLPETDESIDIHPHLVRIHLLSLPAEIDIIALLIVAYPQGQVDESTTEEGVESVGMGAATIGGSGGEGTVGRLR
jgi:hypothetical protein